MLPHPMARRPGSWNGLPAGCLLLAGLLAAIAGGGCADLGGGDSYARVVPAGHGPMYLCGHLVSRDRIRITGRKGRAGEPELTLDLALAGDPSRLVFVVAPKITLLPESYVRLTGLKWWRQVELTDQVERGWAAARRREPLTPSLRARTVEWIRTLPGVDGARWCPGVWVMPPGSVARGRGRPDGTRAEYEKVEVRGPGKVALEVMLPRTVPPPATVRSEVDSMADHLAKGALVIVASDGSIQMLQPGTPDFSTTCQAIQATLQAAADFRPGHADSVAAQLWSRAPSIGFDFAHPMPALSLR